MVTEINESEFDEKMKGKCLVDFFATWCPPCKMLSPVVDAVSEELTDVNFYKVDIDKNTGLSDKYGVMAVPTLILFEDGEVKDKQTGYVGREQLIEFISGR